MDKTDDWSAFRYYAIPLTAVTLDRLHLWFVTEMVAWYVNDYTPRKPSDWVSPDHFLKEDILHGDKSQRIIGDLVGAGVLELKAGMVRFANWKGQWDLSILRLADSRLPKDSSGRSGIERKVWNNINRLHVPLDWRPEHLTLDPHRMCRTQAAARRFQNGIYNVRMGKTVRRIYHVLCTSGSREFRSVVKLREHPEPLVVIDLKSAFPFLLSERMGEEEGPRFREMLDGDIYRILAPNIRRSVAKVQFMILLSGQVNEEIPLHRAFSREFPDAYQMIQNFKSRGESLQRMLQNAEADHVVHTVCRGFNGFAVPVHDAIICRQSQSSLIEGLMSDSGRFQTTTTKL